MTTEGLRYRQVAFEATVTDIVDGQVKLNVTQRFTGNVEDTVGIPQQPADLPSEFTIGELIDGQSYLISADDGVIATCGQSGPSTDELRSIYQNAFGG
ncbi:hypothetical protein [Rhodococcus sp. 14-2470-1a]|uniref:hypothetical protein n=1 Tax=Rhodococcus sp. 14-2470-1a TaxID=2023150 RepID=UPI00117AEC09|nr:hypothetical protein [Rhodococcus sp. 14-2470-1a]